MTLIDAQTEPANRRAPRGPGSRLVARDRSWRFPRDRPLVMGILNATPDSVADLHRLTSVDARVHHGEALARAGADLVDVGGESGRTDRPASSPAEEVERVVPVIRRLAAQGIACSVDTFRVEVAAAAIEAGAVLVNDVSGLADLDMARLAAGTGAGLVVMHTRAAPKQEHFPGYADPVGDVIALLRERMARAAELGVRAEQLVVDPGPDFAKTPEESVAVLRRLGELAVLERPVLLAVSRKYFVGMLTGRAPDERLAGTLAALAAGLDAGAQLVRVHDVAEVVAYLDVRAALRSSAPPVFRGDRADPALKWLP